MVNQCSLLSRKFADSIAAIAGMGGHSDGAAENSAGRRFIDPGTLRLPMAQGGYKHRQAEQNGCLLYTSFSPAGGIQTQGWWAHFSELWLAIFIL